MSIARARALRSLTSSFGATTRATTSSRVSAARTHLQVGRRYASGHAHAEPSSDVPWMIGAVAVTIPTCWFLWPSESHADAGHHGGEHHAETAHHHEEEAEAEEEKEEEEVEEDKPAEAEEKKEEQTESKKASSSSSSSETKETSSSTKAEDKPSGSDGQSQTATTDANKVSSKNESAESKDTPANGGDTDDAQFKGAMKPGSDGQSDTRKREPDSKGAYKKRVDSGLQKDLGEDDGEDDVSEDGQKKTESSATSKEVKKDDAGSISSKQLGMSNTPTRHSTQLDDDPEKSKKGEGTPETAKAMGTVSVDRPAR